MNKSKYVFSQLVAFLNNDVFYRIVAKYGGDRYVKSFTCWNQLLVMMFGQLSNRESLRDLVVALEAHHGKTYHLGMGKLVTKSNLSKANANRDCRIFEDFAFFMMAEARKRRSVRIFNLDGSVYAFDSTTIDLCLAVFWWAKFRKKKGGGRRMSSTTSRRRCRPSSSSLRLRHTTQRRRRKSPWSQALTTSSTVRTTISSSCSAYTREGTEKVPLLMPKA